MLLPVVLLALTASADAPPPENKERILNPGYFDIAVCSPAKPTVPDHVDKEVLQGVLQTARPAALECLTDPSSRGPDKLTKLALDGTLGDKGVVNKLTGTNVTPAGLACAQKAIDGYTAQFPTLTAANGEPGVAAHVEFAHQAPPMPAVQLGFNEASDMVGRIRLGEPGWCDCFTDVLNAPPQAILKGHLKLAKPEKPAPISPTEVNFDPTGNPAGEKVAACLKGKISALKVPSPPADTLVPFTLRLVNGNASGALPGATPDVQFTQYDLELSRLGAQIFIDDGARSTVTKKFGDLVAAYNTHKTKGLTLTDVATSCGTLTQADQVLVADTQKLAGVAKEVHDFAAAEAAKDPAWSPAEKSTAQRVAATDAQVQANQKLLANDQATCDKMKPSEAEPPKKKKGKK